MLNQTLCLSGYPYLSTIVYSKGGLPILLWKLTLVLWSPINIVFAPPFKEKTRWKTLYMKQQKWTYQIYLEVVISGTKK